MILGPIESYDLFLRMGKIPKQYSRVNYRIAAENKLLLPLPRPIKNQEQVLMTPPKIDKEALIACKSLGLDMPVYSAVVGDAALRRDSKNMKSVLYDRPLPENSILHVTDDIYMLSPSLCLLLLSRQMKFSDVEIMFAAFQLCARYAYQNTPSREITERIPHTSASHIISHMQQIEAACPDRVPQGMRRLQKIMNNVHDGARSPREIAVDIMMKYPTRKGGLNFPAFETNRYISLSREEQEELGKGHVESDFVWEGPKVILEYNGDVHEAQRESDSARTNILRDKGYRVEILTKCVLDNYESMLKFMRRLEKPLGFRIPKDANSTILQKMLHSSLITLANRGGRLL